MCAEKEKTEQGEHCGQALVWGGLPFFHSCSPGLVAWSWLFISFLGSPWVSLFSFSWPLFNFACCIHCQANCWFLPWRMLYCVGAVRSNLKKKRKLLRLIYCALIHFYIDFIQILFKLIQTAGYQLWARLNFSILCGWTTQCIKNVNFIDFKVYFRCCYWKDM